VQNLTLINVSLVALWLLLVYGIGRSYRALTAAQVEKR